MDGTGVCHVKWNKPGSERPSSHVFSNILKTDPKDRHIHSANMIIYDIIIFIMWYILLCIIIDELYMQYTYITIVHYYICIYHIINIYM
jgi:hypothetical protein